MFFNLPDIAYRATLSEAFRLSTVSLPIFNST